MRLNDKILLFLIVFLLLQTRCITEQVEQPAQNLINFANMYNPKATTIHPRFLAYATSDTTLSIYTYLYLPQLAFRQVGKTPEAKIYLNIKLTPSFLDRSILDSISKILVIKQNTMRKSLIFPVNLNKPADSAFLINIYIKDLYRRRSNIKFIPVESTAPNAGINFLVKYGQDLSPVFGKAIFPSQDYVITYNRKIDSFWVFHYKPDTSFPKPPYFLGSRLPKRLYADTAYKIAAGQKVRFEQKGIYLISSVRSDKQGKVLVYYNDYFPQIKRASQMIKPLRYLTTTVEYKKLLNAYSPKMAVDSFWLEIAQDPDKARDLIKVFYNRVQLANVYFSTYKEGWQTDRGMIYIMFGLPQIVHKLDDREIWYYYDYQNGFYLKFVFKKIRNRLSENLYVLIPQTFYRSYWKRAVSQWRKGIIPSF